MPKSSSQEPPFVGSNVYNDCNTKRTDEWPSKHNQVGRGAKRQSISRMPKVGCKDYSSNSSSSNKSVIWARKEDDNTEGEAAGWPRWETVSNQNCEKFSRSSDAYVDDSAMACKKGWNESKYGNAKRVTGEGDDVIHHDGLDGWRQSNPNIHMVEKGSLSKSACWDRPADGNGKQETGGWSRWPGATSKATQQCTSHHNSHQNRKGCWNQSEEWTTSKDGSTRACKKGWNESRDGKQKSEDGGDAFDHDGCDGWKQSSSNIHIVDEGSLSKSTSWDQVKDENLKQEIDEWGRWPGAMSKTTRHYTSHINRKGCWNQSKGWTKSKDGSTMACRSGWNAAGDGKETREITDGFDASEDDARDGWRQSSSSIHMADKGSLSNSASWDRAKDENVKKENSGRPRWPGAMSKTIRQFPRQSWGWTSSDDGKSHKKTDGWNRDLVQNGDPWIHRGSVMPRKCDWNKSVTGSTGDSLDIDQKKWDPGLDQTGGDPWKQISPTVPPKTRRRKFVSETVAGGENSIIRKSKWSGAPNFSNPDALKQHRSKRCAAMAETSEQCTSSQNVKGCWNQSWGRIASEFGDSLMENNSRITDLDQSDDPWMEHRPMTSPKCDWNKSASWTESRVDRFDTKHKRWGPVFDQTCRDPWEQHSPLELPRFCRRKSGSLTLDEGKNSFRESNKFSATTDFGDPETLKQLPKIGGESLFRGRSRAPYHAWEHENYQSNDTYKKGAVGVAAYFGDSQSGRSQRSSQVGHQIGGGVLKHPERDTEEFFGRKKARCLGHDSGVINFEGPWKRRDHFHDTESWRQGSPNDETEKNKLFLNDTSCDRFLRQRSSDRDPFNDRGCPVKEESKEICCDRRDSDPCFGSYVDLHWGNGVPSKDFRELNVQPSEEFHSSRQFMLQNKSSDDKWDHKTGKVSSGNVPKDSKTILNDSLSPSHLRRDDEGFRDDTVKPIVTTPNQNVDQDVTNSFRVLKSQQKLHLSQFSTKNLRSNTDETDHTASSPIQFIQKMQVSSGHPSRTKSSNPNDQRQQPPSNLKDEVQHHEQQQAILNGESFKKSENIRFTSNTQDLNVLPFTAVSPLQPFSSTVCLSSSDPVFIQANVDPSSSNLCSGLSPAIIGQKSSTTPEKLKTSSKKLEPVPITVAPSEKILNTSTHSIQEEAKQIGGIGNLSRSSVQTMNCPYSESRNTSLSEPVVVQVNGGSNSSKYEKEEVGANGEVKGGMDDKGIRMFKIALAEFVKEIIKPVWKEGRLSKAAHNTVVKKVVDKVVGVQGTNIPQTQERIDLYLSCAKGKLHKLVQVNVVAILISVRFGISTISFKFKIDGRFLFLYRII
ncbi:hypothetical protein IEQ34_002168 [Dendrobium chrysotoxum]|uniref:Uncharacterized protein n=1 Tax=Dendrobium chrysotoxum TaxID=161865 RepID=A0AAV7HJY6_DENCH|nr:hypothetical protein IEQ34_002168 [Dendrobium chrysotoxum]